MSPNVSKGVLRDKVDWQHLVNVELDDLKDLFQVILQFDLWT